MKLKEKRKKISPKKTPILGGDVDIKKVLVSNKIAFGDKNYKHFIGYLYNNHKVQRLDKMFPKKQVKKKL